jgi:hypothetical protein
VLSVVTLYTGSARMGVATPISLSGLRKKRGNSDADGTFRD